MHYNGQEISTEYFLNDIVHAAMDARYTAQKSDDTKQALQLQNFFQMLKAGAQARKEGQPVTNHVIDTILNNIEEMGLKNFNKFNVGNLFGRRGGARFEREITNVIQAVYQEVSEDDFDIKTANIGSQRGNVSFTDWGDEVVQEILEKVGTKTYHVIKADNGETIRQYYLQDVEGKVDVKGYQINIKANPTAAMLGIYNLLSQATFSAKNYDSMTWDEKCEVFKEQIGHTSIKLGDSNLYRALYGSLSSLNYDDETINSAIFAGMNLIEDNNYVVSTHFYHLRFIYELIGAGIQYQGHNYGGARFLIYNDPHGNIYVKSTAQIVSDILNDESLITEAKALGGIYISKKEFT